MSTPRRAQAPAHWAGRSVGIRGGVIHFDAAAQALLTPEAWDRLTQVGKIPLVGVDDPDPGVVPAPEDPPAATAPPKRSHRRKKTTLD